MKYNGNNKETKEAILKDKMPYLYGELKRLTKLDLLEIISLRDDTNNKNRLELLYYGKSTIQIYVDDVLTHEINFGCIQGSEEYYYNEVFEVASKIENIYIELHKVRTKIIFDKLYD